MLSRLRNLSSMAFPLKLDSAIVKLLSLEQCKDVAVSHVGGGMSSASTSKIKATLEDGRTLFYFMKTGSGKESETMFAGEHASLNAIHDSVPTLCPQSYGHGFLTDSPNKSYLVTEFMDLSSRSSTTSGSLTPHSLAQKLAQLHTTPAPTPQGYSTPQFGFPATTCCGDTPQPNTYTSSWADFYATHRLRFILSRCETSNGPDTELHDLVARTADSVVSALLSSTHLNNVKGITPVVIHGDLWSGNAGRGTLPSMASGASEEVIFDPSACYAHGEYELGIMKMFGGFGGGFLREYHELVPKAEPVGEYGDRVALYELYHHLNHYALFGGGYRSGAVSIMKGLVARYGGKGKGEL